jgi:hypothetical protein
MGRLQALQGREAPLFLRRHKEYLEILWSQGQSLENLAANSLPAKNIDFI